MNFSKDYLDTMLGSAIKFKNKTDLGNESCIPLKLKDIDHAIGLFSNCLKNEASRNFQNTTNTNDPILYTVNLDSENPGIIIDVDHKNSKFKIYNKIGSQIVKEKKKKKKI